MSNVATTTSPSFTAQKPAPLSAPLQPFKATTDTVSVREPAPRPESREAAREAKDRQLNDAPPVASFAAIEEVIYPMKVALPHNQGRTTELRAFPDSEASDLGEDKAESGDFDEEAVAGRIVKLWNSERKMHGNTVRNRNDLRSLREDLAEQLRCFKQALAVAGRGGKWHSFLRQAGIPRTTADRYVRQREKALQPPVPNCTTGAIPSLQETVAKLVQRLTPKLRKDLRDVASIRMFVNALSSALEKEPFAP